MTKPNDRPKRNPVDRFRNILSAGQKTQRVEKVETKGTAKSPLMNLPRAKPAAQPSAEETSNTPPAPPQAGSGSKGNSLLPVFWIVASGLSLLVNFILLIALIVLLRTLGSVNAAGIGSGLLGGLYTNFERMDQAHIRTMIPVQTNVPLNMSIPVQTTTGIVLAQDALIRNAHVKISTATFNIDSSADVTLPAGTPLNVVLNFTVPVQTEVPITLNVPVDIPIQGTELHTAITGLEGTIKPLYC
ncbi:MAG TPA: hypothetical protein VHM28_09965, partial [Anaerolineales bacterium]|nr:hypothetical protein [Anaerolineales bacterium]